MGDIDGDGLLNLVVSNAVNLENALTVDATLREIPEAQAYISSRNLTIFSIGVADRDVR